MEEQLSLLETEDVKGETIFAPHEIREDALNLIAELQRVRSADECSLASLKVKRIMFPHLVSWLPDVQERDQLCFEFARELERIEKLLAA